MPSDPCPVRSQIYKILLALVLGVVVFFWLANFLTLEQSVLSGTLVFLVVLWTNEGLPLGVVSLSPVILFPSLNILGVNETCASYSKSILFLFLGGFFLGLAIEKVDLHRALIQRMFRVFPYTPKGILASLALASAALSCMLSNTTTTLLLMPLAIHVTDIPTLRKGCILAVAYGATIGGIMTPVGTPPNLIFLGYLESNGIAGIPFAKWMLATIPLALVMIIMLIIFLARQQKDTILDVKLAGTLQPLDKQQKKLSILLVIAASVLLLNSPIEPFYSGLGLNEKLLLLLFGLILFFPGLNFLEWSDTRRTPYEILFLFGAGFAIAKAIAVTGLDQQIAGMLAGLSGLSLMGWFLLIAIFVTFTTELTSNMALITVALPILLKLSQSVGLPTELVLMLATICASYAFMLPIATAPNAIAMSSGFIRVQDMIKAGLFLNTCAVILTSVVALAYWKYLLQF